MKKAIKIILTSLVFAIFILAGFLSFYIGEKEIIFSAKEVSLIKNENSLFFTAIITNKGDRPIVISEYGYNDARCKKIKKELVVYPNEEFEVEIECEIGVTYDELKMAGFYIDNKFLEEPKAKRTFSGTISFPSFNSEISLFRMSPRTSSERSNERNPSNNEPGNVASGNTGATNSRGINAAQNNILNSPIFIEISGTQSRTNFIINDPTPLIKFTAPQRTQGTTSISCRWSNNDIAYNQMPASNSCPIDTLNIGICNLPTQNQGYHTYSISCSDGQNYNAQTNNLDLSGTIDVTEPTITNIAPILNYALPTSIMGISLRFNTNENADCKAASGENPTNSYNSMTISCRNGLSHSCIIPLTIEGTNNVNIVCVDNAYNIGTSSISYLREGTGTVHVTHYPSSSGGSGSQPPQEEGQNQEEPEEDPQEEPQQQESDVPIITGEVIKQTSNEIKKPNIKDFFNWIKNIFR